MQLNGIFELYTRWGSFLLYFCYYFITITLPSKNFSHLSTGFTKFYTHSTCFIFVIIIIIINNIASPFLVLITIILISKSCLVITHTLSSFLLIIVLFCNTTKQKRVNYIVTLLENQHIAQPTILYSFLSSFLLRSFSSRW